MGEKKATNENGASGSEGAESTIRLAWWQVLLAGVAVIAMGAGVALPFVLGDDASTAVAAAPGLEGADGASAAPPTGARGFLPGVGDDGSPSGGPSPGRTGASAPADESWSPVVFRMGFSFFVGFAVGFALRTFVKLSLIGIGVFALLLFGLEYAGFLEVRWAAIGEKYDSAGAWLSAQTKDFATFATGNLPSAALAMGGLAVGLKRK